ncbi:uncharacterized protein LOC123684906 [Harmonia axyridis]|uniref:uncharacterized protein LOC123684906 n=1 Tax=Harmonia axyridis TaxID=115357 RepID=UPI001E2764CB|nr:uncharacterized protein LOC123684906 [Harmonia axyridis]
MKYLVSTVLLLLIVQNSIVDSLKCRQCSSEDYDSDCRKGTENNLRECTIEGEDHCYVEYILNKNSNPLYRRGCAPGDWCQQQTNTHGTALKFCQTCQGCKCNNQLIGSNKTDSRLCRKCYSENFDSDCRKGTVQTTEQCDSGDICAMSYISTSRRDIYKRQCGPKNFCDGENSKYGKSVERCSTCPYDLCNNEVLPVVP